MKKMLFALLLGMGLSGAALANDTADKKFEVYGKAGLPNIAVGGGYGINEQLTVRGDLGVMGISRDFDEGDVKYSAKFRNNKANVYADYFPMSNGFRLTGGLALGRAELKADGTAKVTQNATFELGGKEYKVTIDGNDKVSAKVKYPAFSPYLGLGWGHNIKTAKGVWGFTADLGVFIGSPKTSISLSNSLNDKLVEAQAKAAGAGAQISDEQMAQAQAEINRRIDDEKKKIQDKVAKVKVLPMISVGASYRF